MEFQLQRHPRAGGRRLKSSLHMFRIDKSWPQLRQHSCFSLEMRLAEMRNITGQESLGGIITNIIRAVIRCKVMGQGADQKVWPRTRKMWNSHKERPSQSLEDVLVEILRTTELKENWINSFPNGLPFKPLTPLQPIWRLTQAPKEQIKWVMPSP